MSKSHLQETFAAIWRKHGPSGYQLDAEHTFAAPRRWKFDFAITTHRVAIELEGYGPGHLGRKGYRLNCEKYNEAAARGWRVLRFIANDLNTANQHATIETIERTLREVERHAARQPA